MSVNVARHALAGLRHGYPVCCVAWFCLDKVVHGTVGSARGGQASRRGVVDLGRRPCGEQHRYVPCVFHWRRHPRWRPLRRRGV